MPNPEDAFDRLGDALGLTAAPAHPGAHVPVPVEADSADAKAAAEYSGPTAEWSADRSRLIITSPTTFDGETQHFAARTQSFALQPSRATLAARSLAAVNRITDTDERRAAFKRHLADFPPLYATA